MAINNVVLMGRITHKPEMKTSASGIEVINFTIAVERAYTKKGEEKQTDFIDCVAWRATAAFISKYFDKGSMIALSGSVQTRSYEDKNGNKRKAVEILAENVSFCGSKSESGTVNNSSAPTVATAPSSNSDYEEIPDNDDELPF